MSIGNAIRQQRKSLKVTLQALAAQVNADAGNLSRIERGVLGVSESVLRKIADALNCTPAYLYTLSDAPKAQEPRQPYLVASHKASDFVHWFRSEIGRAHV